MNCTDTRRRLSAYLDEELGNAETVEVREHLASCPSCRAELQFLRTLSEMSAKALDRNGFDEALVEKTMATLGRRSPSVVRSRTFERLALAAATVLAAVAIVLLASIYIGDTGRKVQQAQAVAAEGSVFVRREGSTVWNNIGPGEKLHGGDVIRNYSHGVAYLETPKGSRLVLKKDTSVQVDAGSATASYELIEGEIFARVNDEPFRILCDGASVTVGGTSFTVRKEIGRVALSVLEGVVMFESGGVPVVVTSGQVSEALAGCAPTEPVAMVAPAQPKPAQTTGPSPTRPGLQPLPTQPLVPASTPGISPDQPLEKPKNK